MSLPPLVTRLSLTPTITDGKTSVMRTHLYCRIFSVGTICLRPMRRLRHSSWRKTISLGATFQPPQILSPKHNPGLHRPKLSIQIFNRNRRMLPPRPQKSSLRILYSGTGTRLASALNQFHKRNLDPHLFRIRTNSCMRKLAPPATEKRRPRFSRHRHRHSTHIPRPILPHPRVPSRRRRPHTLRRRRIHSYRRLARTERASDVLPGHGDHQYPINRAMRGPPPQHQAICQRRRYRRGAPHNPSNRFFFHDYHDPRGLPDNALSISAFYWW